MWASSAWGRCKVRPRCWFVPLISQLRVQLLTGGGGGVSRVSGVPRCGTFPPPAALEQQTYAWQLISLVQLIMCQRHFVNQLQQRHSTLYTLYSSSSFLLLPFPLFTFFLPRCSAKNFILSTRPISQPQNPASRNFSRCLPLGSLPQPPSCSSLFLCGLH